MRNESSLWDEDDCVDWGEESDPELLVKQAEAQHNRNRIRLEKLYATTEFTFDPRCVLYRCFDTDGKLIYIGQSMSIASRLQKHERKSTWWQQVSQITFERGYESREQLIAAETRAIQNEKPRYNKQFNEIFKGVFA